MKKKTLITSKLQLQKKQILRLTADKIASVHGGGLGDNSNLGPCLTRTCPTQSPFSNVVVCTSGNYPLPSFTGCHYSDDGYDEAEQTL